MSSAWYLLYTKPKHEPPVARRLADAGFRVLLPRLRERRTFRGHIREVVVPLFPCYLFVEMDWARQGRLIRYTRGVRRVVSVGDQPLPVPRDMIETIRQRLDEKGETTLAPRDFSPGEEVLIHHGPMAGFTAVFVKPLKGTERVQVLLQAIGAKAEVDRAFLGAV